VIVGCTGHQGLVGWTRSAVAAEIAVFLAGLSTPVQQCSVVGVCSLAGGADQIFAHSVLAAGGGLHAIMPTEQPRPSFASPAEFDAFTALLAQVDRRTDLHFPEPSEEAYMAAGKAVVDAADVLIAVWDGKPARGHGGTADVVAYAQALGREVVVVWPPGASRS
jgi:hypothetical protein